METKYVLRLFLDYDADLNLPNDERRTHLHLAIASVEAAIKLLLDYDVDTNLRDDRGPTALHLAPIQKDPNLVRLLLEHGANREERDIAGWTALHYACELGCLDIIKCLIEQEPGYKVIVIIRQRNSHSPQSLWRMRA